MKNHKSLIINHQSNIPIQYQKGYVEWYKLRLKVTPDVLIPRPETELLVDEVIRFLSNHPERPKGVEGSITILDLGTGSGNIAIALAKNLASHTSSGNVKIIAIDISKKALEVAKQNANLHGALDKIDFIQSDLLNVFCHSERSEESQDLKPRDPSPAKRDQDDNIILVANLPYIPTKRIPTLDPSVKDFEPHLSLDGGEDGFDLYRKLFIQIKKKYLNPILIIGEIDYTQANIAITEGKKYFPEKKVEIIKDLNRMQRFFLIK